MYKLNFILALLFKSSPSYPGRDFLHSRFEAFQYHLLKTIVKESKKVISYSTGKEKQEKLIEQWGLSWVIADYIQDEYQIIEDEEIEEVMLWQKDLKEKNELIKTLMSSLSYLKENIPEGHKDKYLKYTKKLLKNQKEKSNDLEKILKAAEQKGGYFTLSLLELLGPKNMTKEKAKAFMAAGSWLQAIDDFADTKKDQKLGIRTVFTESEDKNKKLKHFSKKYQSIIKNNLNRNNVYIPLAKSLESFSKLSHNPLFSKLFLKME